MSEARLTGEDPGPSHPEEWIATVVQTAHEAFVSMDATGTITAWNPAAELTFGWSATEAIGRTVADAIIPPAHHEAHWKGLAHFLETGDGPVLGQRLELTALHRDGHEFPVEMTISAVREGDEPRFHAFLHDISERKQEEEAHARTQRYRETQLGVSVVLAEHRDTDDAMLGVLRALGEGLGWEVGAFWTLDPQEQVLHCRAFWHLPSVQVDAFERVTRETTFPPGKGLPGRVLASGEPAWITDVVKDSNFPRAPAAAQHGLHGAVAVPLLRGEQVVGVIEFFTAELRPPDLELTQTLAVVCGQIAEFIERKRAEHEAERVKDEFFSLISHELRSPLTAIVGYAELLGESDALGQQERKSVEVIQRNARRQVRLVGDLLLLAQVEAGRFDIDPTKVELGEVVTAAVEAARPQAENAGIELTLSADPLPPLTGDEHRLAQVLDNLLSNAIKFTPDGGEVATRLSRSDGWAVIEVEDSGMGIAPEERGKLFDRLYRAPSATREFIPGVGLGLTIVKAIVDAHFGRVSVESEEGVGSTFRIELPLGSS